MATVSIIDDGVTVLAVNGKAFVSGLLWKPLRSARNYMSEAKAIGKKENMEMVAIRRGKVLQAGFAPKPKGGRKRKVESDMRGMYSLAASLAGVLGDDWIAAFSLGDDAYAFVAVHKGGVLPGRDIVGNRELIEDLLRETYSNIKDTNVEPRIIAPQEWGFGGEEQSLESLLVIKQLKSDYRLKPLTLGLTRRELVVLGALLFLVIGSITVADVLWVRHKAMLAEKQRQAEQQKLKADKRDKQAQADALIERPWTNTPGATEFLHECASIFIQRVRLDIGGWKFDNGRCLLAPAGARAQDGVIATYHRDGTSTVQDFAAAATALGATPIIADNGETGAVTLRLSVSPPPAGLGEQSLPTAVDQIHALLARMQSIPKDVASITLTDKPWVRPANQPEAVAPGWSTQTVSIQSSYSPELLLAGLPVTGLRLYEIAVSRDAKSTTIWTMKGELYVH